MWGKGGCHDETGMERMGIAVIGNVVGRVQEKTKQKTKTPPFILRMMLMDLVESGAHTHRHYDNKIQKWEQKLFFSTAQRNPTPINTLFFTFYLCTTKVF